MSGFINLVIPGEPTAKQRPKFFPIKTKAGFIGSRAVTPKKTVNYETQIRERFSAEYPGFTPFRGCPLSLDIWAFYSIPPSKSKKQQGLMKNGDVRPTKRPDMDNVIKVVLDALQKMAFMDDSQFVEIEARKFYSYTPRLEIWIKTVEPPPTSSS